MEVKTALVKYVFLDIVSYSIDRTVEAQVEIIGVLNRLVLKAVSGYKISAKNVIYLPNGDGICICLINTIDPYDLHIRIAIDIMTLLKEHNEREEDPKRQFKLRIGINENHDCLIVDINGRNNVAGAGINMAQRIMNMADGNQIMVGQSVYEKIVQREPYFGKFRPVVKEIKHGITLKSYHFTNYEVGRGVFKLASLYGKLKSALTRGAKKKPADKDID
ncbi:MAG: hypothetical protein JW923_09520 [Spirochaetales bacterium]|nr:hypothetical protein [Spirochaetales bacterium]